MEPTREAEAFFKKALNKVENSLENQTETNADHSAPSAPSMPTLVRQTSGVKTNCLCSPTTHTGSFRCRLHRSPSLSRTKSIDLVTFVESAPKTTIEDSVNN
ncbi:hypothetical protein FRX31_023302 [Thalictrum thalictroides]|uniref:Uncharacterized protein n=1 Tax=Thalictrum thalictroides TaxID=46969 RepID=A0A7J6VSF3_THATH|nr:hypothetical protein FRX31_023302 [Thalictrum thalictroides]